MYVNIYIYIYLSIYVRACGFIYTDYIYIYLFIYLFYRESTCKKHVCNNILTFIYTYSILFFLFI